MSDLCAHGAPREGYCPHCRRDEKRGGQWAREQMRRDPGFRREVEAVAKEIHLKGRETLCRRAVEAAMVKRKKLERSLVEGGGLLWFDELSPLTGQERSLVMQQLKRMWAPQQMMN